MIIFWQEVKEEHKDVKHKHKDTKTQQKYVESESEYETESYVEDPTDDDVENTILDSESDEVCFATFYIDGNNLLSLNEHAHYKYKSREVSKHGRQLIQHLRNFNFYILVFRKRHILNILEEARPMALSDNL